jgi:hypothetical protein
MQPAGQPAGFFYVLKSIRYVVNSGEVFTFTPLPIVRPKLWWGSLHLQLRTAPGEIMTVSPSPGGCGHVRVAMIAMALSYLSAEPDIIYRITCRDILSFCHRAMTILQMPPRPILCCCSFLDVARSTTAYFISIRVVHQIPAEDWDVFSAILVLFRLYPLNAGTMEVICRGYRRKHQASLTTTIQVQGKDLL